LLTGVVFPYSQVYSSHNTAVVNRMDSPSKPLVIELISSIHTCLCEHKHQYPFIQNVLDRLAEVSITREKLIQQRPSTVLHLENELAIALGNSEKHESIQAIGKAISAAGASLPWRVDSGIYYATDANVGESYIRGNMHCELAGSEKSFFQIPDFTLGLFLLGRQTSYLDHYHAAPEFYLNLTGPTQWRFDAESWQDMSAGSMLWNEPFRVHATRTNDIPFLAVYCWTRDVDKKCRVFEM